MKSIKILKGTEISVGHLDHPSASLRLPSLCNALSPSAAVLPRRNTDSKSSPSKVVTISSSSAPTPL